MITLTISRDNQTPPGLPLALPDDGAPGTLYVVASFQPGRVQRDVTSAGSRWLNGAWYVSHKIDVLTMELTVRVDAGSYRAMRTAVDVLDAAVDQYAYTITESDASSVLATYQCQPASWVMDTTPTELQAGRTAVTFQIPRQP